jgi:Na+-translocating ferredoxin:NAD+ oxidoreductase subunit G
VNDVFKVIISLTLVTLLSGFIIVFAHSSTLEAIEKKTAQVQSDVVKKMFVDKCTIIEATGNYPVPDRYWIGKKDSVVSGYVFIIETNGYAGPVKFAVGVDTAGTITGMSIVSESEIPARGKRMEERIAEKTSGNVFFRKNDNIKPWFSEQFKGININRPLSVNTGTEWHEMSYMEKKKLLDSNAISAVSGATISSRGIVDGIEKTALAYFNAVKGIR